MLHDEMKEYILGNAAMEKTYNIYYNGNTGEKIEGEKTFLFVEDAVFVMTHYARACANLEDDWTQVQENLADMNLDGVVDMVDVICMLNMYARASVGFTCFEDPDQYYASTLEIVSDGNETIIKNNDCGDVVTNVVIE